MEWAVSCLKIWQMVVSCMLGVLQVDLDISPRNEKHHWASSLKPHTRLTTNTQNVTDSRFMSFMRSLILLLGVSAPDKIIINLSPITADVVISATTTALVAWQMSPTLLNSFFRYHCPSFPFSIKRRSVCYCQHLLLYLDKHVKYYWNTRTGDLKVDVESGATCKILLWPL